MRRSRRDGAGDFGGVVYGFADLLDEVASAVECDGFAAAGRGGQVAGLEAHREFAALAESAALEVERHCYGRDAGADLCLAEFYRDAEELVAAGGGKALEAGFLFWRHASRGVSKAERPPD